MSVGDGSRAEDHGLSGPSMASGGIGLGAAGRQALVFFDSRQALECAGRAQEIAIYHHITGVQSCFCLGAGVDGPGNLLFLEGGHAIERLARTRLRHPVDLDGAFVFPEGMEGARRRRLAEAAQNLFRQAELRRVQIERELEAAIAAAPEVPIPQPRCGLRIFAKASRYGPVIQHCLRSLLRCFEDKGHRTCLSIEVQPWERLARIHWLEDQLRFGPQVILSINRNAVRDCPPGARQVMWWQDTRPLESGCHRPADWRPVDLVYCLDARAWARFFRAAQLDPSVVRQQGFCIDGETYRPSPGIARPERSMVFVGDSYLRDVRCDLARPKVRGMFDELSRRFERGEVLGMDELNAAYGGHDPSAVGPAFNPAVLWCAVVRVNAVRWMCALADEGWRISVYGNGWEDDARTRPHHRGGVAPGADLARVYSSCRYALSVQPEMVNHLRLAEIACSGCIPVSWDCRELAPPPRWRDDQVLFFRTEEGFRRCLAVRPFVDRDAIAASFSFPAFADRILSDLP